MIGNLRSDVKSAVESQERKQDIADSISPAEFARWIEEFADGALRLRAVFWRFDTQKLYTTLQINPRMKENIEFMQSYLQTMIERIDDVKENL